MQAALHLLFACADPLPPPTPSSSRTERAGHEWHQPSGQSMISPQPRDVAEDPVGAFLAHLVAGLAVAWWLRQGEALVWRLCRLPGTPLSVTQRARP
ncbi:hypothetical protein [Streptomyces phaeofaciens]|uniref:hypothetical protein n=1 Tax=Streptomyces phaeofaciens TaxID=68254 RepID=UPI00369AF7AD